MSKKLSLQKAEAIAKKHLLIETLMPRNADRLDFHDCSVRGIKDALEAAYNDGWVNGFINGKRKKRFEWSITMPKIGNSDENYADKE